MKNKMRLIQFFSINLLLVPSILAMEGVKKEVAPEAVPAAQPKAIESATAGFAKLEVDVKKAAESGTAVVSADPFKKAHDLFAVAATKEDYEAVINAYDINSKVNHEASENQLAMARTNNGEALLALGNTTEGFKDRDARLACPQDARLFKAGVFVSLTNPLANDTQLNGKTVAVYCDEGGIGDLYFFLRYSKEIKQKGGRVLAVATTPFVQKILNTLKDEALVDDTALFTGQKEKFTGAKFDYDVHMMSLPTTSIGKIPTPPYLQGLPALVDQWKKQIALKKGLHIAYCYEASPMAAGVYRRLERNIDPKVLETSLAQVAGTQLYCIQGPNKHVPAEGVVNIDTHEKQHGVPFAHTVALLCALRESQGGMFVGVDTGPTNVALAAGTKGYVLLPRVADWRWGVAKTAQISEDTTPSKWAPTLKLLRQEKQNDWTVPLAKLQAGLKAESEAVQKAQA